MVTFRNNNNNRRNNYRRGERNFKSNGKDLNLSPIFQNNDNFQRKFQVEITIMPQKLIEKCNNLAPERLYQLEIRYYRKIIFNMPTIMRILNDREIQKNKFVKRNSNKEQDFTNEDKNKVDTNENIENKFNQNKTALK